MLTNDPHAWLKAHPDLPSLRAAIVDLNGCLRGKRLPRDQAQKVLDGGLRMALSLTTQDIWGRDIDDNPMVLDGDRDSLCRPTGRGLVPIDWLPVPSAFLPLWFFTEDGAPAPTDPRQALARVVARWAEKGLTPVVATELEFYLVDAENPRPAAPVSPVTGQRLAADAVLSIDDLDHFEAFLEDVVSACEASDIPVDTATAEGGPGQFEINLRHVAAPLRAAADAVFFKRIVRGKARQHGLAASFMAKPFLESSGSGFHVHFSVLDTAGRNIFDDGTSSGAPALAHAVGGLMAASRDLTLLFAPHLNSYRRLAAGVPAPSTLTWDYENRFAAIRIPGRDTRSRRIEHRLAGADANPYLVVAAILAAALHGIEEKIDPIPAGAAAQDPLPASWGRAIDVFEASPWPKAFFPDELATVFAAIKRHEWSTFGARMSEFELQSYLEMV